MASQHCLVHGTILGTGGCTCAPVMMSDDSMSDDSKSGDSKGGDSKKRDTSTRPGTSADAPVSDGHARGDSDDEDSGKGLKRSRPLSVDRGVSSGVVAQQVVHTRTGFWNVQNLTGDLIKQGKAFTSEKIDSPRNLVRIAYLASVIHSLGFESLVILEMGSDAEQFLKRLVDALNALASDGASTWSSDISVDNGAVVDPPAEFEADLSAWGSRDNRLWALSVALDYYNVQVYRPGRKPSPRVRLDAHLAVARALNTPLAFTSLLDYGEEGDVLTHEQINHALDLDRADWPHTALALLHSGAPDLAILARIPPEVRGFVFATAVLDTGATVQLKARAPIPPDMGGPFRALRILGAYSGRYEKYGLLRRGAAREVFLFHELVDTPLQKVGKPTNSRAAWSLNLPFGHLFIPGFFIHSMWTPAGYELLEDQPEDAEQLSKNAIAETLRVETMIAQASAASKRVFSPLIIAGDTNVNAKNVPRLNEGMTKLGYARADNAPKTTIRTEKTLMQDTLKTQDEMLSEPYDTVYFRTDLQDSFDIAVAPPEFDAPALRNSFVRLLMENATVQTWYAELQHEVVGNIRKRAENTRRPPPHAKVVLANLPAAFRSLADFQKFREALRGAKLPRPVSNDRNDDLLRLLHLFIDLDPMSARTFWLFHHKYVSDHRLMVIDLTLKGLLGLVAPRLPLLSGSPPSAVPLSGPFVPALLAPVTQDGPGTDTPGGGARVACLSQSRNTCGARAAYNVLVFAGRAASHLDLWGLAAASLGQGGQPFRIDDAVDMYNDRVEGFLAANGAANVPVVAQFLELDGMRAGIYPARAWLAALQAYIANVPVWRGTPLPHQGPAPVLRLVLHTDAARFADRPIGVGHYIAVEIVAAAGGYQFRYMDSLNHAPDRTALIQAFIQRYLP